MLKRDAGPRCPVDNVSLTVSQLYQDNFAKREVLAQDVFCRLNKQHGCPWKGLLKDLENHLKECEFVDITCPEKCGKQMQKRVLQEHLKTECPTALVSCGFCHMEALIRSDLEEHYQDCQKCPKTCERCGKENITRDMMEEHFNKQCPRTKISCPFHAHGCKVQPFRSAVNEHLITHLPALFEWVTAQDVHLRRLQAITDGLQMDQLTQGMQELTLEEQGLEHQENPLVKVIRELNILKEQMLAARVKINVPHCNGS